MASIEPCVLCEISSMRMRSGGTPARIATSRRLVALSPGPGSPPVRISRRTSPFSRRRAPVFVRS